MTICRVNIMFLFSRPQIFKIQRPLLRDEGSCLLVYNKSNDIMFMLPSDKLAAKRLLKLFKDGEKKIYIKARYLKHHDIMVLKGRTKDQDW